MSKITLNNLSQLSTNESSALSTINSNSNTVQTAFDNTLSRDGTSPNSMTADFDMNGHRVLNITPPVLSNDLVRLQDLKAVSGSATDLTTYVAQAQAAATAANSSASSASTSATSASSSLSTMQGLLNGVWTNTYKSVTTSYTVLTGDGGKTLALSGGGTLAVKTVTFSAASGYASNFGVMVINLDNRGWKIAMTGGDTVFLWPGQSKYVYNVNTSWRYTPRFENWDSTGYTFYVDTVSGNNNNDGLSAGSGAFATVPYAWDFCQLNTRGALTIQLALGQSHTPWGTLIGDRYGTAYRNVAINGDPTYINPPIIQCAGSDIGVTFRDNCLCSLTGVKITTTGNGTVGVSMSGQAYVDLRSMIYDPMPLGSHVTMAEGSLCNVTIAQGQSVAEQVKGGATDHWSVSSNSTLLVSANIDLTSAVTNFTGAAFAVVDGGSKLYLSYGSPTTFLNTASMTGPKYLVQRHSFISSSGSAIPGSAGTADVTSTFY